MVLIKLLSKMKCRNGIFNLSQFYDLVVPQGVVNEVQSQPGRKILDDLILHKIIRKEDVEQDKVKQIKNDYKLDHGESECVAYAQSKRNQYGEICIICDENRPRKKFCDELCFETTTDLINIMKELGAINDFEHKIKTMAVQKLDCLSNQYKNDF